MCDLIESVYLRLSSVHDSSTLLAGKGVVVGAGYHEPHHARQLEGTRGLEVWKCGTYRDNPNAVSGVKQHVSPTVSHQDLSLLRGHHPSNKLWVCPLMLASGHEWVIRCSTYLKGDISMRRVLDQWARPALVAL